MMAGFEGALDELLARADPSSLLDVGCGEGVLVHRWAQRLGESRRVVGIDLEEESIQAGWSQRSAPNLEYRVMASREPAVRRRRVRPRHGDRGARARPRPRAHAGRDGALRAAPSARVGPARAAVADAEHGPRRLLAGARQHARASQPLVQALVRAAALALRPGGRGALAVSRGRCCLSGSSPADAPGGGDGQARSYGSGARILSIGIACDGPADVRVLLDREPRARAQNRPSASTCCGR